MTRNINEPDHNDQEY